MKTSVIDIGLQWERPALTLALSTAMQQGEAAQVIVNTTGSSGIKKRVLLSINAISASADLSNERVGAKTGDVWSLLLPINHIAGLNVLARAEKLGSTVVSADQSADYTAIVPTQLHRALFSDHKLLEHLQKCKAVLVGGSPASKVLLDAASKAEISVITTYGMTETSGGCVYNGTPLEGVQIAISDSGFIKVSGPVLATNLNLDSQNWFVTSDLGELVDGQLKVLGRGDDVIISGGENISLIEIESAISASFSHFEFAAFAVSSEKWGQELHVAAVNAPADFSQEVARLLVAKFGNAAKPKRFHQLAALPLIGIGKVDRSALAQLAMKSEF
jgi:O-succinylbenzoic acid--CoA ligase